MAARRSKIMKFFREAKVEITAFIGSVGFAGAGYGIVAAGHWLQTTPSPVLNTIGAAMQVGGNGLESVAVPATIATFGALMTGFGKAWKAITKPKRKTVHRDSHRSQSRAAQIAQETPRTAPFTATARKGRRGKSTRKTVNSPK